tara:strand:- start:1213 stop:2277 length:1065 start_codon:yes stop_codon:yes gene_type:complete
MDPNIVNQLDLLIKDILDLKANKPLQLIFSLGNTKTISDESVYFTPIRLADEFILLGAIVFSEIEGKAILNKIDGIFDIIYIDSEKKSKSATLKKGLFNLERLGVETIKKSKLRHYKGNDITVDSIDKLVFNLLENKGKLIGGSNILIVGLGNIGFKISLRLVERGANINVLTSNINKSNKLIETINIIKPKETIASVNIFDKENIQLTESLDLIILTHLSTISKNSKIYNRTSKFCDFIDVGKGCLNEYQLEYLNKKGNSCIRLDVGDSFIEFLEKDFNSLSKKFIKPTTKIIHNQRFISKGLIGTKGDIVVDNINNPKIIYGICDGSGGFEKNKDLYEFYTIINENNSNNRL